MRGNEAAETFVMVLRLMTGPEGVDRIPGAVTISGETATEH